MAQATQISRPRAKVFSRAAGAAIGATAATIVAGVFMWSRLERAYDFHRARTAVDQSQYETAVEWLKKAESAGADSAEIQFRLGVVYRRSGKLDGALACFHEAGKLGWSPGELRTQRVLAQFQAGNRRDVEPDLHKMLESAPSDDIAEEIYEALVKGYLADLRFHEALYCLNHWIEWRPNSIQARLYRADASSIVGRRAKQQEDLTHVLALDENRLDAGIRLAEILSDQNDIEGALAQFARCHRGHPGNYQALLGMAHSEYRIGRFADAERHGKEASDVAETDAQRAFASIVLGQIAIEHRQYTEAVAILEKATRLAPNEPSGYYNLAIALNRVGETDRGKSALAAYQRLEKLTTRLGELGEEVLESPDDASVRCEAAKALFDLGERQAALRWLISAAAVDPASIEANKMLADHYREQGQTGLAERYAALAERAAQNPKNYSSRGDE